MIIASGTQFHVYSGVNARLAECLNSVLNVKAVVAAFNQEKAQVGAFSVITNLRICFGWNFLKHYSSRHDPDLLYSSSSGRPHCWPGCWGSSPRCSSSRSPAGTTLNNVIVEEIMKKYCYCSLMFKLFINIVIRYVVWQHCSSSSVQQHCFWILNSIQIFCNNLNSPIKTFLLDFFSN